MARGAAGERLAQLEAAIAQLGARLRRLEESSSARASALEQRLGRLEHSLARARLAPAPQPHHDGAHTTNIATPTARARSLESILIANGISFSKDTFCKTNPSSPENEIKKYSGIERVPSPPVPSSRSWELLRAASRGAALEVQQRRSTGVVAAPAAASVGRAAALRDGALPLCDPHANRNSGRYSPLHSAARWGRADVGVARLLLLEQPVAAALEENGSESLRLAKSSATARVVAAYW